MKQQIHIETPRSIIVRYSFLPRYGFVIQTLCLRYTTVMPSLR